MKILVVNPERNIWLKELLIDHYRSVSNINYVDNVRAGYDLLKITFFDLIFLDIELCEGACFKLLRKYKELSFEIVFIVQKNDVAKDILINNNLTFIQKPIDKARLDDLLSKVSAKIAVSAFKEPTSFKLKEKVPKIIAVKEKDGIRFIEIKNIRRCASDNNYTEIYLENGERVLSSKTLKEHEKILEPQGFFRVHQSHLVDIKRIKKIVNKNGLFVKLENGELVELSRRRKEDLLKMIRN